LLTLVVLILATAGCQTLPPLPAANLSEPGWNVRQGQAIWRNRRDSPEIAGEVLLATQTNGTTFIQFTKTPFPLVIARRTLDAWQIEIPTENKRYTGRGGPPRRMIWFLLAQVLSGQPAPANWSWRQNPDNWRLENKKTGESLEGFFSSIP